MPPNDLFADNVALDEPLARRAARAAAWTAAHGSLGVAGVTAVTPMRGLATLRHADGTEREFDLELSPHVPPRLQLYEEAGG